MLLKKGFLAWIGLSAGGMIAAGVFAFLAMIGVFPRLIGKSRTRRHIRLYEMLIIMGGILGNMMDLYHIPIGFGGNFLLFVTGGAVGIFVACLVMSLAETLKAFPVIARRIHLAVGMQWLIFSFALGKMIGAFYYFLRGWGNGN